MCRHYFRFCCYSCVCGGQMYCCIIFHAKTSGALSLHKNLIYSILRTAPLTEFLSRVTANRACYPSNKKPAQFSYLIPILVPCSPLPLDINRQKYNHVLLRQLKSVILVLELFLYMLLLWYHFLNNIVCVLYRRLNIFLG